MFHLRHRHWSCLALAILVGSPIALPAQGVALLVEAAKKGDVPRARAALQAGADANARGDAGLTPLMWASLYGHNATIEALLAAGARINDRDSENGTALGYAIAAQQIEAIHLLRSRGATFSLEGFNRFTWVMSRRCRGAVRFCHTGQRDTQGLSATTNRSGQSAARRMPMRGVRPSILHR
ncbi:MAG: ankyrin repeat domain-containing protein [Gemmatimonadales bacterium]